MRSTFSILFLLFIFYSCTLPGKTPQQAIVSGIAWFDQNKKEINAHGACIIREGDRYYLFGEYKSDTSNVFTGFGCYSSVDLMTWNFENVVLPVQKEGLLGPGRVGERPKVMKCPSTGEFVMYMHCDNLRYGDPHIGYATCKTIDGDYEFHGDLPFGDTYIRKWDMGTFQDTDGKGYILTHHGSIYALSEDYKSVDRTVSEGVTTGESPTMFKYKGVYYWLLSNLTHWERNDNHYYTASSIEGPWIMQGLFAPEGSLTWNSQTTFVQPVQSENDTLFIFMGDRWSYPLQGSAATYVWQPITIAVDGSISIPQFRQAWAIDLEKASWKEVDLDFNTISVRKIKSSGSWDISGNTFRSNEKGASLSFSFSGRQLSLSGKSDKISGYARLTITDSKGQEIISTILDFYCKYESPGVEFLSPLLEEGKYDVHIEVLGVHPASEDKRGNKFGSTDDYVTITGVEFL